MIGGFVWLLIASYFIMFLVGWIAGNLVQPHRCLGVLHGFAAWSLALIIIAALFSQSATSALGTPNNYSLTPVTAHNAQVVTTTTTTQEAAKANLREATGSATTTEAVNKVGIGVLGIFFISLAGALGSCTGGYVGSDARYATRRERHL
jgi:hypothetical protein